MDLNMGDQIVKQLGLEEDKSKQPQRQQASNFNIPSKPLSQSQPLAQSQPQAQISPQAPPQIQIKTSPQAPSAQKPKSIDQELMEEADSIASQDFDEAEGAEEIKGEEEAAPMKAQQAPTIKSSSSAASQPQVQVQSQKPVQAKPEPKPVPQPVQYKSTVIPTFQPSFSQEPIVERPTGKQLAETQQGDFEELWKKGIVVAVNAKLSEMKRIKEDIDETLAEKISESMSKERKQFKILLESQKDLINSSNREALEQKQREMDFIIDSKIAELKQYNKQITDNLALMSKAKQDQAAAMQQLSSSLDDARKLKGQLIIEMNSELIKSKSGAQAFIDQANAHLSEIDGRVNKTLELEKNITEGMMQELEQKIETITIQRADELIADLEVEVNRLKAIEKKISPESLDQKIKVLDEFKRQFLTSMQENLSQINAAIQELNEKNVLAEQQLKEKTLAIDAKLEELTMFEKGFSQKMESILNKE